MPQNLDALRDALLRRPADLLVALHEQAQKARGVDTTDFAARLPTVRIDTQWGQRYEGRVLAVEQQSGRHRVLFALEASTGSALSLAYLELTEPFQITVFEAEHHRQLFRFGELTRWTDAEPPGALELRRIVLRFREWVKPAAGLELSVDDALIGQRGELNAVVRDVLNALAEFVDDAHQDETGSQALKAFRTLKVVNDPGHGLHAAKSGSTIEIRLDPAEGLGERHAFLKELDALL